MLILIEWFKTRHAQDGSYQTSINRALRKLYFLANSLSGVVNDESEIRRFLVSQQ